MGNHLHQKTGIRTLEDILGIRFHQEDARNYFTELGIRLGFDAPERELFIKYGVFINNVKIKAYCIGAGILTYYLLAELTSYVTSK